MRRNSILVLLLIAPAAAVAGDAPAPCHTDAAPAPTAYRRSLEHYDVPKVTLIDGEGRKVALRSILEGPHPIALNFIFTSCRTICPVMTATFSGLRKELGEATRDLEMISITIDPEFDTPAVLREYSRRFGATGNWRFLTGDLGDVVQVQRAFEVYAGSKMNHRALTFLRGAGAKQWVRVEGLTGASDLAGEVRRLEGKDAGAMAK